MITIVPLLLLRIDFPGVHAHDWVERFQGADIEAWSERIVVISFIFGRGVHSFGSYVVCS